MANAKRIVIKQDPQDKHKIKNQLSKIYSKDLLEVLFIHPYTKVEFLVNILEITRQTGTKYLNKLEEIKILKKEKVGKNNYYINVALFDLLSE
ncbi:MAG: hypothetical protein B6I28_06015 [Fusobacteriia bacterium 4572_132]|nr:MAG: hypothetical protein B6I28_06015 [Fusobacteriia bacterium 4572_132]